LIEGVLFVCGLELPPDFVAAGEAGTNGGAPAQGALEPFPGSERGRALVCLVSVVKKEAHHAVRFLEAEALVIGGTPLEMG
jgi:hypothetical protein